MVIGIVKYNIPVICASPILRAVFNFQRVISFGSITFNNTTYF